MGRPVIFGDNPANRELFPADKENVHYVKMGDPAALADKILQLAELSKKV
jgi:glycosyltransferase involved in cell wall biosynthesis